MERNIALKISLLSRSLALVGLLALGTAAQAADPFLWYNGDFNSVDALWNTNGGALGNGYIYEDFVVPAGDTWTITGMFADVVTTMPTFAQATWEIRSGMSVGNGGMVVASGTSAATLTPGSNPFGLNRFLTEINVSTMLSAGTYWINVAPIDTANSNATYVGTTVGANAVGTPAGNNLNNFWQLPSLGLNYATPASQGLPYDFSYGIRGTIGGTAVPEPGTVALLVGAGISGLVLRRRRK
jgi:hypothetical protein